MCMNVSFNYSGACTGRVFKFSLRVWGGGGAKGGEGVKQMCVNESLNYSDRCMQFIYLFLWRMKGHKRGSMGQKKMY
jgi:hypothetical protein